MKRSVFLYILIVIVASALCVPAVLAAKFPIEIQYVTFIGKNHKSVTVFDENWREIEKRSQGKLKFINRGGPEAIKIFAQAQAVRKGATDMVLTTPSFMGKMIKGASMLTLNEVPVSRHREIGLYDYMNEVFNKVNMQFIQMYPRKVGEAFLLISKEKIETVEDFKGKALRGGDYVESIASQFGMTVVALKYFEEYSALERGVIDIGRMTPESMAQLKLYEVAKYLIKPAYGCAPMSWFMNLRKWKSIPPDLQELILDTLYELAPATSEKTQADIDKAYEEMFANGVEVIEFQGKDREVYLNATKKAMYDYFLAENPEVAQKIFDLTRVK